MHVGERQFKSEMLSQKKLSDLYEDKLAQNEERTLELQNLVSDLEGRIDSFAQERTQLLVQNEENLKSLQQEVEVKDMDIQKLKAELENVNRNLPSTAGTPFAAGQASQNGVLFNLLIISLVF
jgi:hypothetical protein